MLACILYHGASREPKNPYMKEITVATKDPTPHKMRVAVVSLVPVPPREFCSPIVIIYGRVPSEWGSTEICVRRSSGR